MAGRTQRRETPENGPGTRVPGPFRERGGAGASLSSALMGRESRVTMPPMSLSSSLMGRECRARRWRRAVAAAPPLILPPEPNSVRPEIPVSAHAASGARKTTVFTLPASCGISLRWFRFRAPAPPPSNPAPGRPAGLGALGTPRTQ